MRDTLLNELSQILEVDVSRLQPEFVLEDGNWDSVSMVSVIGFVESQWGISLDVNALWKCVTVSDLVQIFEGKKSA